MKEKLKNLKINPIIFFTFTVIYLEILSRLFITNGPLNIGILYTIIFSIPIIILLTLLSKLFGPKLNKFIMIIMTLTITVYFGTQLVFLELFPEPFAFTTIGLADQAADNFVLATNEIKKQFPLFISLFIPLILLIIFNKKIDTTKYNKYTKVTLLLLLITTYLSTYLTLIPYNKTVKSIRNTYYNATSSKLSTIDNFGMLTFWRIDLSRLIFDNSTNELEIINGNKKEPEEIKYDKNELELDFTTPSDNATINQLNNYFNQIDGTYQNEYTGMFEGKNIIFILAEGFNEIAVDKERTPTLYKLINEGFVFEDFYSPEFLSTTGGEFQAVTGLVPTQENLTKWKTTAPEMEFAIGNAFKKEGYRTQAYHNWTHTYYKRQVTMGTLGYDTYIGCGNGLEQEMRCGWLTKDTDLINVTTPKYLGQDTPFATYYITLSGHAEYSKYHNVAREHYDLVADLPYSDGIKYYLASQVELDRAVEQLIKNLKESGELEDTVIALVGDHYPYSLEIEQINEVSEYKKDDTIEVNHSNFIIWNSEMKKTIKVKKVGSQIDVLPTLLNLFGVEYDSRLMIGKDILSDSEGIAIFSDHSWVTDYGTYNYRTGTFTLKEGKELENQEEYINNMNAYVNNAFSVSKMIIDTNYYTYILNKEM